MLGLIRDISVPNNLNLLYLKNNSRYNLFIALIFFLYTSSIFSTLIFLVGSKASLSFSGNALLNADLNPPKFEAVSDVDEVRGRDPSARFFKS